MATERDFGSVELTFYCRELILERTRWQAWVSIYDNNNTIMSSLSYWMKANGNFRYYHSRSPRLAELRSRKRAEARRSYLMGW